MTVRFYFTLNAFFILLLYAHTLLIGRDFRLHSDLQFGRTQLDSLRYFILLLLLVKFTNIRNYDHKKNSTFD